MTDQSHLEAAAARALWATERLLTNLARLASLRHGDMPRYVEVEQELFRGLLAPAVVLDQQLDCDELREKLALAQPRAVRLGDRVAHSYTEIIGHLAMDLVDAMAITTDVERWNADRTEGRPLDVTAAEIVPDLEAWHGTFQRTANGVDFLELLVNAEKELLPLAGTVPERRARCKSSAPHRASASCRFGAQDRGISLRTNPSTAGSQPARDERTGDIVSRSMGADDPYHVTSADLAAVARILKLLNRDFSGQFQRVSPSDKGNA